MERHYGLNVGDTVEERAFGQITRGIVHNLPISDNNRAYITLDNGEIDEVIPEWCTIIRRASESS